MFTKTEQADRVLRESLDRNESPLQAGESEKKCSQGGSYNGGGGVDGIHT